MQPISKKPRVVFASVLDRIDDTRMFEKMATTIARHGYQVYIIAQPSNSIPANANINFIPTKRVKRLSLSRLLLPLKIGLNVFKLKPEILVVNTHELLIVSIVNRILFGGKIVYDIRENYYRNLWHSEAFRPPLKWALAWMVRAKEKLASPLFHHFILAEKSYEDELTFLGKKYTILENKAALPMGYSRSAKSGPIDLIFTGTIAQSTGIFEAISLASSLHQIDPKVTLKIVGFCSLPDIRHRLESVVRDKPFITQVGINEPVPHGRIMKEIAKASFGIIYYPPSPHTNRSMPTKLYEYMACQLPILTWPDQSFANHVAEQNAGLLADTPPAELLDAMRQTSFYTQPIANCLWEGDRFIDLIEKTVQNPPR